MTTESRRKGEQENHDYLHQSNAPHCALTLPEGRIRVLDGVNDDELGERIYDVRDTQAAWHAA